jgi:hypothetical protein
MALSVSRLADPIVRAFSDPTRDASLGARSVEQRDGRIVLRGEGDGIDLAVPNREGAPYRPTISGDGTRAAWLRREPGRAEHIEVTRVRTGLLGSLRRLTGRQYISFSDRVEALDLNHDGSRLACLSPGKVTLYPVEAHGPWLRHDLPVAAPGAEGVQQRAVDVECVGDDAVAVLTEAGTAYQVDASGAVTLLSLPHDRSAVKALDPEEGTRLLDRYGDALQGVSVGPDTRHCVLSVRHGGHIRSLALDRQTGDVRYIGDGPGGAPMWSPDGLFVAVPGQDGSVVQPVLGHPRPLDVDLAGARWTEDSRGFLLADGQKIPLSRALTGWEMDLGASSVPSEGQVLREADHVVIAGVRVQRRR